ncbi:MAG TPA: radical SAM family heme chaperone HemW [Candidatus Omnitrophota bacterium]|nr:radical SAM family heme chaperone HemW [Candidatus Omnitrophota bacterium]HPS20763.1 radical SAM family heme chaperone HemW [Candidatus Omnitrophota bacterium]
MENSVRSIYIHVPFCTDKCDYCAFYSVPGAHNDTIWFYLGALEEELRKRTSALGQPNTIFIGGGNPLSLPDKEFDILLSMVVKYLTPGAKTEFTVEANPESISKIKTAILASHPVTRISMGVQSFDKNIRGILGRKGALTRLDKKFSGLVSAGIKELNIDLIYGIPGQTLAQWEEDLSKAAAMPITHLSAYNLTIEKLSPISKRIREHDINDIQSTKMWKMAEAILARKNGIKRYEISNYAKKGHECRHNLDFWHGCDYIGFGPAAVSSIGTNRSINPSDIKKWARGKNIRTEKLTPEQKAREILILGLRTVTGADMDDIAKTTGINIMSVCRKTLGKLSQNGLLRIKNERAIPTKRGLLLADTVAVELI